MLKMGSLNPDSEAKQEFDDSGYVQEDNKESPKPSTSVDYRGVTELLDLSDDVLLYILRHCSPMDLKALGFTCNRLAALILDRTLWTRVDARERPCGPRRVRWFMAHAIGYNTTSIKFSGYARDTTPSTNQVVNRDQIDVGASGDGPSTSQASCSHSSGTRVSPTQVSGTSEALAQIIMSHVGKSKPASSQASNNSTQATQESSAPYHIIEAFPRQNASSQAPNDSTQAPSNSAQASSSSSQAAQGSSASFHVIEASPRQHVASQATNSSSQASSNCSQATQESSSSYHINEASPIQNSNTQAPFNSSQIQTSRPSVKSGLSQDSKQEESQNLIGESKDSKQEEELQNRTEESRMDVDDDSSERKKEDSAEPRKKEKEELVQASSSKDFHNQASTSKCSGQDFVYADEASGSASASQGSACGSASASQAPANNVANGVIPPRRLSNPEEERVLPPRLYRLTSHSMPRYGNQIPYWPESLLRSDHPTCPSPRLTRSGPQVTMTSEALGHLSALCPKLEELALEYCVIDCATVNLSMFPNYLKKLSFRGSKCYNMEKSFLFKIQDYLSELEVLDLSYCEWVEPACMLPLSKMQNLHTLYMRECPKLSEFVAYASLATRYGFKSLKVLDLRGSPVGDSEVSALGWLPRLEHLLLARAEPHATPQHVPTQVPELEPWEEDEPEFFRNKRQNHAWLYDEPYYKPKTNKKEPLKSGDKKKECVLLKQMVAEPVAPDEYSSVYKRFFPPPHLPKPAPCCSLTGPDDYRDAFSTFLTRNPRPEPSAFIITNNRTYSIVHNEDENGNDPNGQAVRIIHCNPGRSNNDDSTSSNDNDKKKYNDNDKIRTNDEKPGPSRVIDENGNDELPTPAKKMKIDDASPGPSKSSENTITSSRQTSKDNKNNDESDSDDDGPKSKRQCQKAPDTTPCSSKSQENQENSDSQPSSSTCQKPEAKSSEPKTQRYVRFRQYQPPIVIEEVRNNNDNNNDEQNNNSDENDNREPKHRILFVNVGRRRHAMYQLSMPVCTVAEPVDLRTNNVVPNSRNVSSLIYASPVSSRLDHGALVTDSAIRRFGRADGENISYVHIGPNGPIPAPYDDPNARPNRSNLRVLSATGFRHITNTSLVHLATAAPHLRFIDFTGTSVTRAGVEQFKSLRPDCKVKFSNYEKKDKIDKPI